MAAAFDLDWNSPFTFPRSAAPRHALVTGASGGIGLEFARQLVECPAVGHVFAVCRRPDAAGELQELAKACPGRLTVGALEIADEASVAAMAAWLAQRTDEIDLVVNCTGVLHDDAGLRPERRLEELNAEALARSFAVNAMGPALVARYLQPLFPKRERAVFASLSARVGSIGDNRLGGWYSYRASKAALNQLTRTLAVEMGRRHKGLVCLTLHPGTTDTNLSKPFQAGVPEGKLFPPGRSVRHLLEVIDGATVDDSGKLFAWDGQVIPW